MLLPDCARNRRKSVRARASELHCANLLDELLGMQETGTEQARWAPCSFNH